MAVANVVSERPAIKHMPLKSALNNDSSVIAQIIIKGARTMNKYKNEYTLNSIV